MKRKFITFLCLFGIFGFSGVAMAAHMQPYWHGGYSVTSQFWQAQNPMCTVPRLPSLSLLCSPMNYDAGSANNDNNEEPAPSEDSCLTSLAWPGAVMLSSYLLADHPQPPDDYQLFAVQSTWIGINQGVSEGTNGESASVECPVAPVGNEMMSWTQSTYLWRMPEMYQVPRSLGTPSISVVTASEFWYIPEPTMILFLSLGSAVLLRRRHG